ncbi:MAG: pyridoxal-phosphate dependent enzyme [Planctomycetia bacterium]|nr:pyridoxal-phosphate dependent enzyme [Planctomycetia bacterium]
MSEAYVTPIVQCISQLPDVNIYLKRDDLLPFSFGGNKVRIAEEFFRDMEKKGCNCMIGYGNARSNLCRALVNLSCAKGFLCHIISPADDNGSRASTFNSKMIDLCGTVIHECKKTDVAETVERVNLQCEAAGYTPYYIYGDKYGKGNEATPVRAYAGVYRELKAQSEQINVKFDAIFVAVGTGMTLAGLLTGRYECHGSEKIIGISVARDSEQEKSVIRNYLSGYYGNDIDCDICVDDRFLSGGYGLFNDKIAFVIMDMLTKNGIPLDPTYTGKAFYGMLEILKETPALKNVLFIHTGGMPLFFDFLCTENIPRILKMSCSQDDVIRLARYLTENSAEFAEPLADRVNILDYATKILQTGYVFAAVKGNEIIGVVCGYANDKRSYHAYESVLVTSRSARGTGVAKILFEHQLDYCRQQGMKVLLFSTNRQNLAAVAFYKKMNIPENTEKSNEKLIEYQYEL